MVGAVLVRDGEVVGRGFHTYAGVQHAEVIALAQAGEARAAPRSTQSGTLLPPGPHAALHRRPDRRRRGARGGAIRSQSAGGRRGISRLAQAGSKSKMAAEFAAEAAKLNEPFLHFMRTGRPLVTLKTAITLDGKISAPDDNRGWITSERARAHVQQLRHDHDAISPASARCWPTIACSPTAPACRAAARCCAS
jgi:diaminohydroxyphosphoribosylaminopyrimidine deaminase / 5-amino-6-(5-phosphoribosylamino)uracil reductase